MPRYLAERSDGAVRMPSRRYEPPAPAQQAA